MKYTVKLLMAPLALSAVLSPSMSQAEVLGILPAGKSYEVRVEGSQGKSARFPATTIFSATVLYPDAFKTHFDSRNFPTRCMSYDAAGLPGCKDFGFQTSFVIPAESTPENNILRFVYLFHGCIQISIFEKGTEQPLINSTECSFEKNEYGNSVLSEMRSAVVFITPAARP